MQSRIASHEALVLTQRVIGLYCPCAGCPVTPLRRLQTNELWAAESVFLRVGIGLKSTSRLRMADGIGIGDLWPCCRRGAHSLRFYGSGVVGNSDARFDHNTIADPRRHRRLASSDPGHGMGYR
jgi:hypothetical protein